MSYTTRYTAEYTAHNGKTYEVAIHSTVGSGASDQDLGYLEFGGLSITWEGGDAKTPLYPIVASSADLSFYANHNVVLNNIKKFASANEEDTYISIKCQEDGFAWYGNLLPEETVYEIVEGRTLVNLAFADGLGLLKTVDFKYEDADFYQSTGEEDGGFYQRGRTGLGMLQTILYKIPWYKDYYAASISATGMLRETPLLQHTGIDLDNDSTTYTTTALLPTLGFDPEAFKEEKKDRRKKSRIELPFKHANCYDVLADILETVGCKICWNGFEWHVYSPMALPISTESFVFSKSDFVTSPGGRKQGVATTTTTFNLDDHYSLLSGSSLAFTPTTKQFIARHEDGGVNHLFKNTPIVEYKDGREISRDPFVSYTQPLDWANKTLNGVWKHENENFRFVEGESARLRFKADFGIDRSKWNKTDYCNTNHLVLAVRFKAGTTSHTDPYIIDGPLYKKSQPVDYRYNLTDHDFWPWDPTGWEADTDKVSWQNVSQGDGTSHSASGILYIPMVWNGSEYSPSASSIEINGVNYPGTAHIKANGDNNKFRPDDTDKYSVDIDFTFPEFPTDLQGYEFSMGLVGYYGHTAVDTTFPFVSDLLNTYDSTKHVGQSLAFWHHDGTSSPTQTGNGFNFNAVRLHHVGVYVGEDSGHDRDFYINEGQGYNSQKLIDTRVATSTQGYSSHTSINQHNSWSVVNTDTGADWNYDNSWYTVDGEYFYDGQEGSDIYYGNLPVLLNEFVRRFSNGITSADLSLAENSNASFDFLTPDMYTSTTCVTGANTSMTFESLTWNIATGVEANGIILESSRATAIQDADESIKGDSGFGGGGTGGKGENDAVGPVVDLSGKQDLLTGNTGDFVKFDSNGDPVSVADDKATETYVDNGLALKVTDPGNYTTGNKALVQTATGVTWKSVQAAEVSIELEDVNDVVFNTQATDDLLQYNGTNWVNTTIADAIDLASIVGAAGDGNILQFDTTNGWEVVTLPSAIANGSVNIIDLGDVDSSMSPSLNDTLIYSGGQWTAAPSTAGTTIESMTDLTTTSGGNTSTRPDSIMTFSDTLNEFELVAKDTYLEGISIDAFENVDLTGASNGDTLVYDSADGIFYAEASTTNSIAGMSDVSITSPATGSILRWNNTNWIDSTLSSLAGSSLGGIDLADLKNVIDSGSVSAGDILSWNGSKWVDRDLATAGIAAATHTHVKADITDFDDADYAAASHQHVKADISDFDEADYATGAEGDLATTAHGWGDHSTAGYLANINSESLGDLSDVDFSGLNAPSTDDYLRFNGSNWVPTDFATDVAAAVSGQFASATHTHVKADITDFNDADYATAGHTHAISDITNLQTTLDGKLTEDHDHNQAAGSGSGNYLHDIAGYDTTNHKLQTFANAQIADTWDNGVSYGTTMLITRVDADFLVTDALTINGNYSLPTDEGLDGTALINDGDGNPEWLTLSLDRLSDVDTTTDTPDTGDVLMFDGTNFVPDNIIMDDLFATAAVAGDVAYHTGTKWSHSPLDIDKLSDVDTSTTAPSTGDVLEWDGTNWVPTTPSGGSTVYTFDKSSVHLVTSATDGYTHVPASTTFGAWDMAMSVFPTTLTPHKWRMAGHTTPDTLTDITVTGTIGGCTTAIGNKFEATELRNIDLRMRLYKLSKTGTWSSLGSAVDVTMDSSNARLIQDYTLSVTGASVSAGDSLIVVMQPQSLTLTSDAYIHHNYTIVAE